MKTVELINKNNNEVVAIFTFKEEFKLAASGILEEVVSWGMDGEPFEKQFVTDVSVKWDGCSHFSFFGEDYPNDKDSYYHLCGVRSYLQFMRMLVFLYTIMVDYVGKDRMLEKEEYQWLLDLRLLDDYKIKYNN